MLDLAWSEIALIAIVAIIVIGPKDLPGAVRGVADLIKKAKRQFASFQQQADELVREANLEDVRNQIAEVKGTINEIRSFDLKGEIAKHVDGDGTVGKAFEDPFKPTPASPAWTPPPTAREVSDAPAMIPPQTTAPLRPLPDEEPAAPAAAAPAFVPPAVPLPPAGVTPVAPEPLMPPALSEPRQS